MNKNIVLILIFCFLVKTGLFSQENNTSQDKITTGKKLYMKNCASCHGSDGKGNTAMGKAIQNMVDLSDPVISKKSDQELFNTITNGKPPMPSFKKLSTEERWDLVHYIRTLNQ